MPICSYKQCKFAINPPIFFIFNFWSSDMSRDHLKIYSCGKIYFVLGLQARDIANHSRAPNTPLTHALNRIPHYNFLRSYG